MGIELIFLLLQVWRHCLVDVLEHGFHRWLGLAFRRFERLWGDTAGECGQEYRRSRSSRRCARVK